MGKSGHSKDHRPDLKQMVVGVVLDSAGHPICCELWPGNTTDVQTLLPIVKRLRKRLAIGEVCIVADRGMIRQATLEHLEARHGKYILGARLRRQKEVSEEVLSRGGRYQVVHPKGRYSKDPAPLKVKEVWVEERRYIVCLNEDQRSKEALEREAIVRALREQLKRGDKSLVGNKGYRRYLKSQGARFAIDEQKIFDEARYDGTWVLRTNTDLSAAEVALKYKQLWMGGVSSQGHILQSVKVRPRLRDSGLVAGEAPWRESKTVKPSDNIPIRGMRNIPGCNVQ